MPILEEVKNKEIKNNDGKPTHILIEGDNYHALTCLNYTHKEKIDLIYIDPPYNTGSDGFRYRDKRVLETFPDGTEVPKDHPLRHSYWLSFMSKRIELAHLLLKDDAVMFISINEEEYSQLKLLCDRIFQESNYLTTFTVKVRHEDRNNFVQHTLYEVIRIVTADDVTHHKPEPETFLKCAELVGVKAENCQVLEDGVLGMEAAKTAGMFLIDVRPITYENFTTVG